MLGTNNSIRLSKGSVGIIRVIISSGLCRVVEIMQNESKKIFSENPEEDLWKMLLHYSYPSNILGYFKKNSIDSYDDDLIESISGSLLQAREYYFAARGSSLQISPLLLYYGTINLLSGIGSLISGKHLGIKNHGMSVRIPDDYLRLADFEIIPSKSESGGLAVFIGIFCSNSDACAVSSWKLVELFGSIPDILNDFLDVYEGDRPHVIPVSVTKKKQEVIERIKVSCLSRFDNISDALVRVNGLEKQYLIQRPNEEHIVLRPKMFSKNKDIGVYSLNGQKHLLIDHDKNGSLATIELLSVVLMVLFALGYVCRYNPSVWNPFVRTDTSGEKLLVENFMGYARRAFPNIVLNHLYKSNVKFVSEPQGLTDLTRQISQDEIKDIVKEEIRKYFDQQRVRNDGFKR